jgi:ankyrin repeat protein
MSLHAAAELGDVDAARALLCRRGRGGVSVSDVDRYADTALHKATARGEHCVR